jgi:O-acetyl-ADP-ribose deacetylase (regulator of RNase III)
MGKWNEIYGNLVKSAKAGNFDLISHGCNCQKNFGAGIALEIKKAFPLSYEVDKNTPSIMGHLSICTDYPECIIVNSYTQKFVGKSKASMDSEFHRYEAIRSCMNTINLNFKGKHIGLPLIGCGLAGLKWNKVKKILQEELVDMDVTIVHLQK